MARPEVFIEEFEPVDIMSLESLNGLNGAEQVWNELEKMLKEMPEISYALHYPLRHNRYIVGVGIEDLPEATDNERLLPAVVPGGTYAVAVLDNWPERIKEIAEAADALEGRIINNEKTLIKSDISRPRVEIYHSAGELMLLQPVEVV